MAQRGRLLVVHRTSSVPVRTCVGCRRRAVASELLRVVVVEGPAGLRLEPDPRRRSPGRGASLHLDLGCLDLAERRRAFGRALRVPGSFDAASVREYVSQHVPDVAPEAGTVSVPRPSQAGRKGNEHSMKRQR
ncbi:MAG TPA: YlxR family protein [Mycobacteriales bacterium]|nr:YlxR family protein [Mycobacteriales bacterium]